MQQATKLNCIFFNPLLYPLSQMIFDGCAEVEPHCFSDCNGLTFKLLDGSYYFIEGTSEHSLRRKHEYQPDHEVYD